MTVTASIAKNTFMARHFSHSPNFVGNMVNNAPKANASR